MPIRVLTKKVERLSNKEIAFMNRQRIKEYGKEASIDFKKEDKKAIFFFVIDNKKIKAFGMLKPIIVKYQHRKYNIFGIGRGLVIEKRKGYEKS